MLVNTPVINLKRANEGCWPTAGGAGERFGLFWGVLASFGVTAGRGWGEKGVIRLFFKRFSLFLCFLPQKAQLGGLCQHLNVRYELIWGEKVRFWGKTAAS